MDVYIEKVISAAITVFVGMGIAALVAWIKYLHSQSKATKNALKAVVHDSHHKACRILLTRQTITEDEMENLECLHKAYTELGMNGTGKKLYEEAKSKPLKCGSGKK